MKKILAFALTSTIILSNSSNYVYASTEKNIPFSLLSTYTSALEKDDTKEVVKACEEIVAYYEDSIDTQSKLEILTPKLEYLAKYYEKENNIEKSIYYYEKYIPYAKELGWSDGVRANTDRLNIVKGSKLKVFTSTKATPTNFGALYEPNGILFGKPYDSLDNFTPTSDVSIVSKYVNYGSSISLPDLDDGMVLLVNLNIPRPESTNLNKVTTDKNYLKELGQTFKNYDNPIMLRFGAEMNVWEPTPDSQTYIDAYRFVYKEIKSEAPNVAMIWSPNDLEGFNTNMEDYYPGDEYVDWIGTSSYSLFYFLGNNNNSDVTNASFFSDKYANPITRLSEVLSFANNKPVIITEGGAGHLYPKLDIQTRNWAIEQLTFLYTYLPILAPEVKAILHFDTDVAGDKAKYHLYDNDKLMDTYNQLTSLPSYISSIDEKADIFYKEFTSGPVSGVYELVSYTAPIEDEITPEVAYEIDHIEVYRTSELPYTYSFDTTSLSDDGHTLTVKVFDNYGKEIDKETFSLNVYNNKLGLDKENTQKDKEETQKIGHKMSSALYTDIRTYINDVEIPSYNIEGSTAILASDLREYGFDVLWDNMTRTVSVTKNNNLPKGVPTSSIPKVTKDMIGTPYKDVLYTDIITKVAEKEVDSFNVDNSTSILVKSLESYCDISFDNTKRRVDITIK